MSNLFEKKSSKISKSLKLTKEDRLKRALKTNMQRRKNQIRVRSSQQETSLDDKSK